MGRGTQKAKERAAAAERRKKKAAQRVPRTPKYPPEYKEKELKTIQEVEKFRESRQPPVNKQQKPKSEDLPEVKTEEPKKCCGCDAKKEASASGPAGSAVGCAAYNLQCLSKCKAEKDATACEANCGKLMDLCKQNGGK